MSSEMIDNNEREKELEKYGVWVKSAPKDAVSEESTENLLNEDTVLDMPDFSFLDKQEEIPFEEGTVIDDIFDIPEESSLDFPEIDEDAFGETQLPIEENIDLAETPIHTQENNNVFVEADMSDAISEPETFTPTQNAVSEEKEILQKITVELSALHKEFASLRYEFETLQKSLKSEQSVPEKIQTNEFSTQDAAIEQIQTAQIPPEEFLPENALQEETFTQEISTEETPKSENTGFFSGEIEDEAIALSGDELSNILASADLTQENAVKEEHLEEPVIDSVEIAEEESLPQEITIEQNNEQSINIELTNETALTEDNISYLKEDEAFNQIEEIQEEETDLSEPTEEVFASDQWAHEELAKSAFGEQVAKEPDIEPAKEESAEQTMPPVAEILEEPILEEPIDIADEVDTNINLQVEFGVPPQENKTALIPSELKQEIKSVLGYMDQLLENLPEEKIAEFAQSEHFETYKKLFKELGLS